MKHFSLTVIDDAAVVQFGFDLLELNDVSGLNSIVQIACNLAPEGMRDRVEATCAMVREIYGRAVETAAKEAAASEQTSNEQGTK